VSVTHREYRHARALEYRRLNRNPARRCLREPGLSGCARRTCFAAGVAGSTLYLEALASGVQIYECTRKPDASYEWVFKAPEATLTARSGKPLGRHYAGPTWEGLDGSAMVGEIKARHPAPSETAIPWLLLAAKSNTGSGAFSRSTYVQRVATVGGVAPARGCGESTVKNVARVPYSASYFFYR
jgi:hypothetical protein